MSDEKATIELSKNAQKIMDLVKELPVLELANLVKGLEEEFGVSAAAPMMMAGGGGGAAAEDAGPSTVDVILTEIGGQKIPFSDENTILNALGDAA